MDKIKGYDGSYKIVVDDNGERRTVYEWMPLDVAKECLDEGIHFDKVERLVHKDDRLALRYHNLELFFGRPMIVLSFDEMCFKMIQNVNGCKRFPPGDIAIGVIRDVERRGYRCDSSDQELVDRCREVYDALQWEYLRHQYSA